ncbi:hypothetical protein HD554DRAFT_2112104 [Boletus coccyginus]|nr:hypothetical protein HD554DRAFT_2151150 [Boletus coccyginus]KAI9458243.1 hypothetical protein HD554DRAFT_2140441 [Boletus coccyginus]KAI9463002.1 hypothetical protein HD554DRAFT_2126081 [Boletus coccyginus]KAI9567042.1 hypothetical protein HD554DRAFT_2112104 [Boletus coccyginus]
MESLDLDGLAKSLPASNFEKAEKELLNNFKAAALSITTLYRSSRHASKRAYNAGYASACQDLMIMIQQGVSTGGIAPSDNNAHGDEMTVGRILDWIEARMEAVKSREEEEDEDEERERARVTPPSTRSDVHKDTHTFPSSSSQKPSQTPSNPYRPGDGPPAPAPLTPHSPVLSNNVNLPHHPSSPSPTPTRPTITSTHSRVTKARPQNARKDIPDTASAPLTSSTSFPLAPSENLFRVPAIATTLPDSDFSAGAKRRHAVMMMLDATPSTAAVDVLPPSGSSTPSTVNPISGNARRRTRSQRSAGHVQLPQLGDSMDVEEDGPQRKRIARR